MTVVLDSSVVVAALVDAGPDGTWAEQVLVGGPLMAPHLMLAEAANILRRACLAGEVDDDVANSAHADLLAIPIEFFAYEPLAERVWQLRGNLTAYDACFVALTESLDVELATLDARLSRSTGPRCRFLLPPP